MIIRFQPVCFAILSMIVAKVRGNLLIALSTYVRITSSQQANLTSGVDD